MPVGCYVSGGLDSTAIASLLVSNFDASVRTFGFASRTLFDEGRFQGLVIGEIGTKHTIVEATDEKIGQAFPDVLWHCERPLLRTAPVPLYLLSRSVHDHGFKVVLTGRGPTRSLGDTTYSGRRRPVISSQGNPIRHFAGRSFASSIPTSLPMPGSRRCCRRSSRGAWTAGRPVFVAPHPLAEYGEKQNVLLGRSAAGRQSGEDFPEQLTRLPAPKFAQWDPVAKAQYLEMRIFLGNYLLSSQGDRVAMANSVEIRMPYLDYRLVEFMGRVPIGLKIGGLQEKYLLKKAVRKDVPSAIWEKPKLTPTGHP